MVRTLLLAAIGTAGAVYFLDPKKGPRRRKLARKQCDRAFNVTREIAHDCSRDFAKRAHNFSEVLNAKAREYYPELKTKAEEYYPEIKAKAREYYPGIKASASQLISNASHVASNGSQRFSPSARLTGALASALAFYGAGRHGATGTILRTLSLGLFTRALLSAR